MGSPRCLFRFCVHELRNFQAMGTDKIGSGRLCEGQERLCACILAEPKTHWCLVFTITCNELSERVTGNEFVEFSSLSFTKPFVHSCKTCNFLSLDNFDIFDMEECVKLANNINKRQGFRVLGWFKPACDDDGIASG